MEGETFSQRLNPEEVQMIFDVLHIPWRDKEPNRDGWVEITENEMLESLDDYADYDHVHFVKPSFNIFNGGYVDHYYKNQAKAKDYPYNFRDIQGDIVDLVCHFKFYSDDRENAPKKAITWIKDILHPEKERCVPTEHFAKNIIANGSDNYVMVPNSLWSNSKLSASSRLVWIAIFERCGKGRHYSFASLNKIADDTGLGRSTVQRGINELKEFGYLDEVSRGDGKSPQRYPISKPCSK